MPIMYQQNTLQMEWCLNCHRNPGKNIRPTSEIYNMAWAGPSKDQPVYCATISKPGPTAGTVTCTTTKPAGLAETAMLQGSESGTQPGGAGMVKPQSGTNLEPHATSGEGQTVSDQPVLALAAQAGGYKVFTSQTDLGHFLMDKYHIRTANELSSCEVCHR